MTNIFCWSGRSLAVKPGRFPTPTSFTTIVCTFVPRLVTMNSASTPRGAEPGLIRIARSVTVTLIGTVAAVSGARYSSLKSITTSTVGTLKEVWHMHLGTCTAGLIAGDPVVSGAPKGSAGNQTNCGSMESNPVAVDGVLYTTNSPL